MRKLDAEQSSKNPTAHSRQGHEESSVMSYGAPDQRTTSLRKE
jgi:hypothetical protein